MTAAIDVLFGVLGLAFGSFATVLITRVPAGESVAKPTYSKCPRCGTRIRARDNIPVLSYLILRGKCRSCGERISPMYPLVEATVALLFIASGLHFSSLYVASVMALFFMVLVALSIIDIRTLRLPNRIIYPSYAVFGALVAVGWALGSMDGIRAIAGVAIYGGGVFVVWFVYPKGMGFGDVRLAALIGLVLGSLGLGFIGVAAGAAILLAGVVSIAALATGKGRKAKIPFGPFLAAGAILSAFVGHAVSSWYLSQLGR